MQLNLYLAFSGQCEEAFKFYEKLLGGKITFRTKYGESPMAHEAGPEWRDKVTHLAMGVDTRERMGADALPQYFEKPRGNVRPAHRKIRRRSKAHL
jgi:PhnB protein